MNATDRRAQVLEVAAREFGEAGLRGASIEEIARAAGITQPYVFRIFGSKKALFLEVVSRSFTKLAESMRDSAEGATGLEADQLVCRDQERRVVSGVAVAQDTAAFQLSVEHGDKPRSDRAA